MIESPFIFGWRLSLRQKLSGNVLGPCVSRNNDEGEIISIVEIIGRWS